MAKLVDQVQDGKDEIAVAWQTCGFNGPHWTMWGKGICLHIYEDSCLVSRIEMLTMAEALEKSLEEKGGYYVRV